MTDKAAVDQAEQDALDNLQADYEAAVARTKAKFAKLREAAEYISATGDSPETDDPTRGA